MGSRKRITVALVGLVLLVLAGWLIRESGTAPPAPGTVSEAGLPMRPLSVLPAEATSMWRLVEAGGPFPYPRNDGSTFENRERLLPQQRSGYYREYTVPTPGSPDRGPRRLVTGAEKELFYTDDHYVSFVSVDPTR